MSFKKIITTVTVLLVLSQVKAQEKVIEKTPITIGESVTLHSEILDENRTLNIYLPQEYTADSTKTYPVIYLLDGSMDEDFIHISGLVQFGSFSWINMIPETIVVGISNIDRKRDFTFPTTIKKHKTEFPTTGGSEKFIKFIETELQSFINSNYNVNDTKTIIGQSLGGLLATEILYKKPELFNNYIIISPSLWWDNQSLLKLKPKAYTTEKKIYIAVGKEGKVMEKDAENLYKTLDTDKKENTTIHFSFFKELDHGDTLHLAVYTAFEALFRSKKN
ncbi:alpha/beta hydrolase-fold protein [Winogradskyella sp.]|uniref:alpha/beta hydrolase n=1 Tax=Winogradskyella sp. TaxID=1883156 RepID=UPI0025F77C24|nr:alpha/beta hydrolase-fold protein [Winogradskyella sp.]